MAVEPKPDGKRSIGVGLAEGPTPLLIPQVKVEMIDVGHLSPPVHVGVGGFFLTFAWPGFPDGGLLLCLLEFQAGNVVVFGKTLDGTHVLLANLAKGGRRRDREISLPAEKTADVAHGLQLS